VEAAWYSWWEKQGFFSPEYTEDYLVSQLLMALMCTDKAVIVAG